MVVVQGLLVRTEVMVNTADVVQGMRAHLHMADTLCKVEVFALRFERLCQLTSVPQGNAEQHIDCRSDEKRLS